MTTTTQNTEDQYQRIQDCRDIYLKHDGKNHDLIEKDMRALGYHDFHRRNLYRRFERGYCKPGWVETYGWTTLLREQQNENKLRNAECGLRNEEKEMSVDTIPHSEFRTPHSDTIPRSAFRDPHSKPAPVLEEFEEFKQWLKATWPNKQWEWRHQVYIYKHLKRVWDGECDRLMIFLPPRHGKSELVTVRFPAWALKHNPETKVIIGSYNQKLANNFSRKVRSALADDAFVSEPPASVGGQSDSKRSNLTETKPISKPPSSNGGGSAPQNWPPAHAGGPDFSFLRPKNSESEWQTPKGGGVLAVGMGAGVTGYGAQLIIIDDPIKSRAEAESETIRDKVWNWFNDDIYTRLEPNGKIILIQTRWHEDDLAGRLLREAAEEGGEHWEVVNLPALSLGGVRDEGRGMKDESISDSEFIPHPSSLIPQESLDCLGRKPGEALCPKWFDEEKLEKVRRKLGNYSFEALYQQRPTPAEGGLFKRAWFRKVNSPPPNLKWKRGYDLGITKSSTSDYTATLRVAYDTAGNMYIADGFRRRIEYPEQRRMILGRILAERDTEHGIELSANGNAVVQDLRTNPSTRGRPLRGIKVKGDKVTNALPWIALAEEGKVFLVRGPWNQDFIDEAASFPSGTHDDQIDATSIAVRMHRERSFKSLGC